jgi:hypothetical protein
MQIENLTIKKNGKMAKEIIVKRRNTNAMNRKKFSMSLIMREL